MTRVLAVCLGNICRSPTAEAVIRAKAEARGLSVEVDSAGTGSWHIGNPPHPPAIRAGAERGYDLSGLRGRKVSSEDFAAFDLILAMDAQNQRDIEALRPAGNDTPVRLFLDYAPDVRMRDVPDPYFDGGFDEVLDLVEAAAEGLLDQLQ